METQALSRMCDTETDVARPRRRSALPAKNSNGGLSQLEIENTGDAHNPWLAHNHRTRLSCPNKPRSTPSRAMDSNATRLTHPAAA